MLHIFNQWYNNLTNSMFVSQILSWARRATFPGSAGNSMYDVIAFILDELKGNNLMLRANAIAFSFFLSLFPSIIVLFTLIAFTPYNKPINDFIRDVVHELMPGNAETVVMKTIKDLTTIKRNQLLSVGFILAMYFSTNGMMAMMSGFQKSHKLTFRRYGPIERRWIAIKLTFLLGVLLVSSVFFGILGSEIVEFIGDFFALKRFDKVGLTFLRYFLMLTLLYGGISIIYRLGVPLRKKLPLLNPGAIIATLLSILVSLIFSYYVDNFGSYNRVYGSIGTLIVFMLWLQLNIFNLLIGFELNAAIAVNRDLRALKETDTGQ